VTGFYLRLEAALAVARNFDLHFTEIALQRLGAGSVPRVAAALAARVVLLIAKVMSQFGNGSGLWQMYSRQLPKPTRKNHCLILKFNTERLVL
jgi:hypothetical protein